MGTSGSGCLVVSPPSRPLETIAIVIIVVILIIDIINIPWVIQIPRVLQVGYGVSWYRYSVRKSNPWVTCVQA